MGQVQAESDWNTLFDLCVVNYMHYERGEIENPDVSLGNQLFKILFSNFHCKENHRKFYVWSIRENIRAYLPTMAAYTQRTPPRMLLRNPFAYTTATPA